MNTACGWTSLASARAIAAEEAAAAEEAELARHEHCGTFHHGSCQTDTFLRAEIARLQAENARLEREASYWYMKANHSPSQIRAFQRRRASGPPWRELDNINP